MEASTAAHLDAWAQRYFIDETARFQAIDAILCYLYDVDHDAVERGLSWPKIYELATREL